MQFMRNDLSGSGKPLKRKPARHISSLALPQRLVFRMDLWFSKSIFGIRPASGQYIWERAHPAREAPGGYTSRYPGQRPPPQLYPPPGCLRSTKYSSAFCRFLSGIAQKIPSAAFPPPGHLKQKYPENTVPAPPASAVAPACHKCRWMRHIP